MNSAVLAIGSIILLVGLVMLATGVPAVAIVGILVLLCAFIVMVVGAAAPTPKPKTSAASEVEEELQVVEPTAVEQPPPQPVTKEVYRQREIIREIVKIRCRHCGSLFEEKLNRCPNCGAPP